MPPTQISGSQINKRWALAAGVAFTLVAAAAGVISQIEDSSGNITRKDFADGSREQSGSLLISRTNTAFWVDAVTRMVGVRTRNPKTELEVLGTMSGESLHVSRSFSGAGLVDCDDHHADKVVGATRRVPVRETSFNLIHSANANYRLPLTGLPPLKRDRTECLPL